MQIQANFRFIRRSLLLQALPTSNTKMTDSVAAPAPVAASPAKKSPAKKKAAASKVKKSTATHPTTSVMVIAAIKELKEKKGSSLPAIKKYLAANYKVDPAKLAPFIRKFLKAAVANKTIVQTKGTGASGHFKLAAADVKPKKKSTALKKKPAVKKAKSPGSPKKKKSIAKKVKTAAAAASGEPAAKKAKKAVAPKPPKAAKPKSKAPKKPAAAKAVKKTPAKKPVAAPKKK